MTLRRRFQSHVLGIALAVLGTTFGASSLARADGAALPAVLDLRSAAAPGRIEPLKTRAGLASPQPERAVRLEHAKVILADYPLIRHDFGTTIASHYKKAIEAVSNDEIDGWLLDSTAYISAAQAKQTIVNTPIAATGKTVTAHRPDDYGRALVYEPAPDVLIDVKGAGATKPRQDDHANGLASLGEAIREYAYEHLVHKVFEHAGTGQKTVGHYAVIDAGFDVKYADGHTDPAGLVLRQAHSRARGDLSALDNRDTKAVETTLRRYGITSAGAYQHEPYDMLNLQGTANGAVLDFGGFLVMPGFTKKAYHFDRTPEDSPRHKPLLAPNKDFVHPDENMRVPNHLWGYTVSGKADPVLDNPTIWSHELATAIRQGRATRADAEQHMRNLMGPVEARLAANPAPPPPAVATKTSVKPHTPARAPLPVAPARPHAAPRLPLPPPGVHAPQVH